VLRQSQGGLDPEASAGEPIDLYRFFAHAVGVPSVQRFQWLHCPEVADFLRQLWDELQCPGQYPGASLYGAYGDYESTYVAVFEVGLPAPPVPLQETAHDEANPAPQMVLENVDFYAVLGLTVESARYAPDHLVTQLEFLAAVRYARENTPDPENRTNLARLEREFLERHLLNWLPIAQQKLAREEPPLFPVLFTLLLAFLRAEQEELAG
jgi:DMSO reductase family type II enzyme chaperone